MIAEKLIPGQEAENKYQWGVQPQMEYLYYPFLITGREAERLLRGKSRGFMVTMVAWTRPAQVYG